MVLSIRRIFGATLVSLALLGGSLAAPAGARQHVVRAHIAVGCFPAANRHHHRHASRCQSAMRSHVAFAHAA